MRESNLEILHNSDDLKIFKTTCQCTSEDHTIDVIVEKLSKTDTFPMATLMFKSLIYPKTIWERIKVACCVLFKGYYDSEEEFIFRDETHLMHFSSALYQAIKEVKQSKQDINEDNEENLD